MEHNILAVSLDEAPQNVQDEIRALKGNVHSLSDMDNVSMETKKWIFDHASPTAMAEKMSESIEDMIVQVHIMVQGITMMKTIMPERQAEKLNLKLFNACAEYVRRYNIVHMEDDS